MKYIEYHQNLLFAAKPDYYYSRKIFNDLFMEMGFQNDKNYEWEL